MPWMAASAPSGVGCALRALFTVPLLLLAVESPAHRGHAVWTDITWVGDRFEIVHRMHLADAITVNRFMGGRDAIEAPRSLARVALYVEERFKLTAPNEATDGEETDEDRLDTIGAEIEDDFMFVYQEWVTRLPQRFPALENTVLLDVEPDAQAFVRILGPELDEERERR